MFTNTFHTSKRTPNFIITKIDWLVVFKEIVAVFIENHTKPMNEKNSVTDCYGSWDIQLSPGFKRLIFSSVLIQISGQ
jgi:hypothetical protein